ncbi:urease accessory protein UreF [bacterium]|nr:MAG: urease accessory protein UreF [bacterium]
MDSSWLQHAQILDSALPIGAFSHSFGLETLIAEDCIRDANDLKNFVESVLLGGWSSSDALLVKGAYTLQEADIWRLDTLLDTGRVSRETREGMRKMGRQGLKLARAIHPHLDFASVEQAMHSGQCVGSWPLIYGVWTRELSVPIDRAVEGYLYGCSAAALGNAVRLSLVGQTAAQSLLSHLLPAIEAAWKNVQDRDPFDFCTSLPVLEVAQMRHESQHARLFMS